MLLPTSVLCILLAAVGQASDVYQFSSSGRVQLDSNSSVIVQFLNTKDHARHFLLNETAASYHSPANSWGAGTVVANDNTGTWNFHSTEANNFTGPFRFTPVDGLDLHVRRSAGDVLTETYIFENTSPKPVEVTGIRINTPFNDLYDGAAYSLATAVTGHVFTGGAWAWVFAAPMSGKEESLGLILRKGHLWSYSIENTTSSNIRGHILLQPTDKSRNAEAFGGQPSIWIEPGESYTLEWDIALYANQEDFLKATHAPAKFSRFSAPVHEPIFVESDIRPTSPSPDLEIRRAGHGRYMLKSGTHGAYQVDIGNIRTEVSFNYDLKTVVNLRAQYVLDRQRPINLTYPLNASFVPYNTETEAPLVKPWSDKGDGSERLAIPTMLQLGAMKGWLKKETVLPALDQWVDFASTYLFGPQGNTTRCSGCGRNNNRPYDAIWFVGFFNDRYVWLGNESDLDTAVRILNYAYEIESTTDVPMILYSQTVLDLCETLETAGRQDESSYFKQQLITLADKLVAAGQGLPPSEVSYEQAIVEPLVELVADVYRLTNNDTFLQATKDRLDWLLALSGPQPHARQYQIAMRHWDDYWFGERGQFGDVYPHYWSALTSQALLRLPQELRTRRGDGIALDILRSNMLNFFHDGSATCAFVFPSALNGEPAWANDPLANDQDWLLVIWMRALKWGVPPH
ncbi:hypothetical protein BJY01DRAFT_261130 [Aspergillus pseudoustus]|uniref:Six-hairpin glycosidase-like protein n=1 Tax=Aspergillus pseudoustus TaxID=1810923 RepID=A0ABR4KFR3_9EURO